MRSMIFAAATMLVATSAVAEEITLRSVTAFATGTTFSRPFDAYVKGSVANFVGV